MEELIPGIKGEKELLVTPEHTAEAMGSGGLAVLATPALIALMEGTAMASVQPMLSHSQGTVGTAIAMQHTAATPVGMRVRCRCMLTGVDGRKLTFAIEAEDETGPIGSATHERFIIDSERFMEKAQAKLRRNP